MTKKINKPELAILNDVFVTVASQIKLGNLRSTTATVDENVTSKYNLALS